LTEGEAGTAKAALSHGQLLEESGAHGALQGLEPGSLLQTRNPDHLNEAYFEFLTCRRRAPMLLEDHWLPPVTEVYRSWRS
jgi:hypothetical protein